MSSREAAEALGLSVKTVETHRQSLKRKLQPGHQCAAAAICDQLVRQPEQAAGCFVAGTGSCRGG